MTNIFEPSYDFLGFHSIPYPSPRLTTMMNFMFLILFILLRVYT